MKRALSLLVATAAMLLAYAPAEAALATPRAPQAPPATTSSITDLELSSGESGVVYDRVDFRSSHSYQRATITIKRAHDITFRNCVFQGSAWNAITINDRDRSVHNIRFQNCYVKSSARMGFECTSRGSGPGYVHVDLVGVTLDPQGSEAVSYDGQGSHCKIRNVVIRGSGINPDFPWGQGFELNGPTWMAIDGLTIRQGRGSAFNLSGYGIDTHWTFKRVRADMTVRQQGVSQSALAQVIIADRMVGSTWTDCVIRAAAPGGGVAYLSDCDRNDLRGITWRDARGGTWDDPWMVNGCAGNLK